MFVDQQIRVSPRVLSSRKGSLYCSAMEQTEDWASQVAAQVGERISRIRKERGMTAQALSDRCAELGLPLDRSVIAKLERGLRAGFSVAELLVVARALNVPPMLLIFPVGRRWTTTVLPGVSVDTWGAVIWFIGESPFPDESGADPGDWKEVAEPATLWRQHADIVRRWHQAVWMAAQLRQFAERDLNEATEMRAKVAAVLDGLPPSEGERGLGHTLRSHADFLEERAKQNLRWAESRESDALEAEDTLDQLRHSIRARGLLPPRLAGGTLRSGPTLEHIDEPDLNGMIRRELEGHDPTRVSD